jgi:hypothetical protein
VELQSYSRLDKGSVRSKDTVAPQAGLSSRVYGRLSLSD